MPSLNSLNISPTRAPRGSRNSDDSSFVEYEVRRGDTTRDTRISASLDGRRIVRESTHTPVKRRRLEPSQLEDPLAAWVPLRDEEGIAAAGADEDAETGDKRKRYESSDEPMKQWRPYIAKFLDEILRVEGSGMGNCACCGRGWVPNARRLRCAQCGVFAQCEGCMVARHQTQPLHCPEEWNGRFWVKVCLRDLGLVFQLGHGGWPCPHPAGRARNMITFQYCGCDAADDATNIEQLLRNRWYPATTVDPGTCATFATLETFRLLNVVGNLNVQDFVKTMERRTDATRVGAVPDRYKAVGLMTRQWAFLKRLNRLGRGHNERGVSGTRNGELAVLCWACPHDGVNLPLNWREVAPEFQFLYMLIIAVDANFRLRHRLRPNERDDPPLGSGWGYMQEEEPYKAHLRNYVEEKDVSTCIAFQALLKKNTRVTTGLRCSGVGGVVCARHELLRPQGLGDLQKGERYSNMDYIVLASILGITLLWLAISYDVACQWRVNFRERMEDMPEHLQLDLAQIAVLFALPVWHASAHERKCQTQNSLTYTRGVGRTDGEGIERFWSRLIAIAEDAMEDKVDHENFEKNIGQVTALPRKLVVAIDERDSQVAAFAQVDATLEDDVRAEWQSMIEAWEADRERKNPYESMDKRQVCDQVGASKGRVGGGVAGDGEVTWDKRELVPRHGVAAGATTVSVFAWRFRIRREISLRSLLIGDQTERIAELRRAFFVKLRKFRRLQAVHMPGAVEQIAEDEEGRDCDAPAPQAEDVRIYLPSGISDARRADCAPDLIEKERRLRVGQLGDWVAKLRRGLLSRRHLWDWREENVGQRAGTRAATLAQRVQGSIDEAAKRYRASRAALFALGGDEACEEWPELRDEDLRVDEEREADAAARQKLSNVDRSSRESRKSRRARRPVSEKRVMSWIWTWGGAPEEEEEELREAVRIEWSRAKARRDRWVEEVQHLREEMRRVLRFLQWKALWWEERSSVQREVRADILAGLRAYAARQAASCREISRRFKSAWDASASDAVRAAIAEDEAEREAPTLGAEGEDIILD
ncbi:CxC2 domain-containing protein [Favolaschia claudopus]|uniref:CxC2 domain-containing protein n=1 Tax=Favolaschia claudopus TaxID=2862362 RepID=A0AAV9ZZJ4_9AGAR